MKLYVLLDVEGDPHKSQRQIGEILGISQNSVKRISKIHRVQAQQIQLFQKLLPGDFEKRVNCEPIQFHLLFDRKTKSFETGGFLT